MACDFRAGHGGPQQQQDLNIEMVAEESGGDFHAPDESHRGS